MKKQKKKKRTGKRSKRGSKEPTKEEEAKEEVDEPTTGVEGSKAEVKETGKEIEGSKDAVNQSAVVQEQNVNNQVVKENKLAVNKQEESKKSLEQQVDKRIHQHYFQA